MRRSSLLVLSGCLALVSACSRHDAAVQKTEESAAATTGAQGAPTPVASAATHADPEKDLEAADGVHGDAKMAPRALATATAAPPGLVAGGAGADKGSRGDEGTFGAPAPATAAPWAGAASVKAGEWDDNANYREFQKYLASVPGAVRKVDVRSRRFLVVRDVDGKGVPRCPVTVRDEAQHEVALVTTASGRAILFPYAENLTGKNFTATATCAEDKVETKFSLTDDGDGTVDLKLGKARALGAQKHVDLAFVLDTTGSMSEEIASVKTTIQKVADALRGTQIAIRIGLVEYKDRTDSFDTKVYPLSSDLMAFAKKVSSIEASGGGDTPEDMNAGLHVALTQLEWSKDAVARLAFVIGDAPPHLDYQDGPDYAADMKLAAHRGIQLFGIAASGMDSTGQAVFRQMAQYTGGTEMFVLRGGAGPQSVGGGDPASSCGGTQQQYSSGKLDELITSKVKKELALLDYDPMKIPGLRTDESAKTCDQRVVIAWER
jgi:Mg-chelatase subunit ChlD